MLVFYGSTNNSAESHADWGALRFPRPGGTPIGWLALLVEVAETIVESEHATEASRAVAETFLESAAPILAEHMPDEDDGDEVTSGDFTGQGVGEALDEFFEITFSIRSRSS